MTSDILQSYFPVTITAICLGVLSYLGFHRRERFVLYWAAAWAFACTRFTLYALLGTPMMNTAMLSTLQVTLRLSFAASILAGVLELRGRRVPAEFLYAGVAAFVLLKSSFVLPFLPPRLEVEVNLLTLMGLQLTAGLLLAGHRTLPSFERRLTSIGLSAYAVISYATHLMPTGEAYAATTWLLTWALQLIACFGMFAIHFRVAFEAELRAQKRVGFSLTEALGEFVPVCMHCKSIRDEQSQWQPLERFLSSRTNTKLSHGLCPPCAKEHYDYDVP